MQLTFRFGRIVLPLLILSPSYSAFLLDPKQTVSGRRTRSWAPEELPRPESSDCRSGDSDRFCDPDSILLKADNAILGEVLKDSQTRMVTLAPSCTKEPSKLHLSSEVQFSVVILKKMDFDSANSSLVDYRNNSEKAAEIFAQKVHDDWEVGHQTESCGGTGILLFLSIDDRAVYVSRGAALRNVLSDRRLDQTIESIRPDLIQYQYGKAIMLALQDLDNYLIMGEPDWKERTLHVLEDYSTYLIFLIFFGVVGIAASHEEKKRREYAKVASHLNELDQARAEALQGRFQAKSCPICLENFQSVTKDEASTEVTEDETEALTLKGSDGLPLRLLRCGHVFDEACWEDWISSGHHGKVGKCPVCQQDIGQSSNISVDATRTVLPADASTRLDETSEFRRSGDEDIEIRNRVFRQYTHDRNFRLLRLASRYPQYIRPQQIQSWTQVGYDGSLARDPSFMGRDPTRLSASSSSSGSSASGNGGGRGSIGGSGFGGGCSGGGRGGRW